MSNNCFKYAPKWMVSSLIFQKFSGEGLTEPPPHTPPPAFSRALPSVRASPSILGRFAPSTRASPSILGRFAPSIRASPLTFDWGPWFAPPPKKNEFLDPPLVHWAYTITWVPSGFSGYIWFDTKTVLKKPGSWLGFSRSIRHRSSVGMSIMDSSTSKTWIMKKLWKSIRYNHQYLRGTL